MSAQSQHAGGITLSPNAPVSGLIFKSRRSGSAAGASAPLQAGAERVAGAEQTMAPAVPLPAPFVAYALCWPQRRRNAPPVVMLGTLSRLRSSVQENYLRRYREPERGLQSWLADKAEGAFIGRFIMTADPGFDWPGHVRGPE